MHEGARIRIKQWGRKSKIKSKSFKNKKAKQKWNDINT
jgi:hypothetical protein